MTLVEVDYFRHPFGAPREILDPAPAGKRVLDYAPEGAGEYLVAFRDGDRVGLEDLVESPCRLEFFETPGTIGQLIAVVVASAIQIGVQGAFADPAPKPIVEQAPEVLAPARNPNGIANTFGAGLPLPVVYGQHRVGGHIIDRFVRPRFAVVSASGQAVHIVRQDTTNANGTEKWTRIALAGHRVEEISDILAEETQIADVRGVVYETRLGAFGSLSSETELRGFSFSSTTKVLDTTLGGSATTFETDEEVDELELILRFPQGIYTRDNFNLTSAVSMLLNVEYRQLGSSDAWVELSDPRFPQYLPISDRHVGPINYSIQFPKLARAKYEIRVTIISTTTDTLATTFVTELRAHELVQIVSEERVHPGIAQLAIYHQIDDTQGQFNPTVWSAVVKGKRILVYTDLETSALQWSENPAWCALDFLLDARDGLGGAYTIADVDLESWLDWANYCDELVPDGQGGTEKRCIFGWPFDVAEPAQDWLARFAVAGDAWLVRDGGVWRAVIDRPATARGVYSDANIIAGSLRYTPLGRLDRATQVTADFTNRENEYIRDSISWEDDEVNDSGAEHVPGRIALWGVTRPSHAIRTLERIGLTNRYSDRVVEFDTHLAGIDLRVGDLFELASRSVGVSIATGLVQRVTKSGNRVYLDDAIVLEPGTSYVIRIEHRNGIVESKAVTTNRTDSIDWVDVAGMWGQGVEPGDHYVVGEESLVTERYRVSSITLDAADEGYRRHVVGRLYDSRIFTAQEGAAIGEQTKGGYPQRFCGTPTAVLNLTALAAGSSAVDLGWEQGGPEEVARYRVYVSLDEVPSWIYVGDALGRAFRVTGLRASTDYTFAVVAVSHCAQALDVEDSSQASATTGA